MKTLSRTAIQRMIDVDQAGGSARRSGGGSGSGGGGGGVSQGWVDENYVSKEYFNQIFEMHVTRTVTVTDENDDPVGDPVVTNGLVMAPNEIPETTTETDSETGYTTTTTYVITDLQVKMGLWTNSFVSALGLNSGGGGGGATALNDLVDVALSNPQNGQVLMYNSTTNKWYNGTVQSGSSAWADITGKPNTIGGYGITDAKIQNGTITLGSSSITPLTSSALSGYATQQWVQNQNYLTSSSLSGYATQQWVNSQGFLTSASLSGYATQQWVNNQGFLTGIDSSMVTTALGYTPMSNTVTFWGQSVGNGAVNGIMTFSTLAMATNYTDAWSDGTNSHPWYGYDHRYPDTGVFSTTISDFYGLTLKTSQGYLSMNDGGNVGIGTTNPSHNLHVAGGTVRIGNILLVYDSTNNALMVQKSDGTAANLYATGAVSALGFSAGTSAVDAMTFGYLKVNSRLTLPTMIVAGNGPSVVRQAVDSDCVYLFNSSARSKINSQSYYYNQYDNVGLYGTNYNYDETWWIDPDGCALFQRVYLSNNVYLYTDGSNIKVKIGSTVYTLTKS